MQPRTIAQHDPHYAHERGFQTHEAISGVHELAATLGDIADKTGMHLTEESFPMLTYVKECLTLGAKEALLDAKILEPHDSFVTAEGVTVDSRFLVVDARSSALEEANETDPTMRVRAYFLLLGASTGDSTEIWPFYIISKRESTDHLTYEAQDTHIFNNRFMTDLPIRAPIVPHRIHAIEPYVTMHGELQLAVGHFVGLMPSQK